MSFRLRYAGKTYELVSTLNSTVEELMAEIRDQTGVFPSRQHIQFSFPQKTLPTDAQSLDLPLEVLGIGKREMFTLTEKQPGKQPDAPVHAKSALSEAVQFKIPGDNSCLFNSVSYLCNGSANRGPELRRVVVEAIRAEPSVYTPGMLGCSPDEYCKWIMDPMHWGGYIELGILSKHFNVEICVLYIEQCKVVPVKSHVSSGNRIYILYDNIHYDAVYFKGFGVDEKRIVKADDGVAEQLALDLCRILQQAGAFSKPESCTMRCDACGKVCQGQAEAEKHMKATGHADFSEVKI